ncbi:hypothetical protein V8B55DRAFT_1586347 [Mucor lusitanicus]
MTEIRVPFLPTIKCTGCQLHIDIRTLDKHACCVPITSKAGSTLPLSESIDNQALPPPNTQRRSRERSNALNNSVRRIFQKIKGNDQQYKSTDSSVLSPTLSTFSSTSSHQTIPTPRSSQDYVQQYFLKQDTDPMATSQKNNRSLIRLESRDRKKPVTETAVLEQLVASMNIKDDLCQACSKFIALCEDEVVKDPVTQYSYHQTCYCCSLCRVSLSISSSFQYHGKLYCVRDYQVMKSRSKPSPKQQQAPLPTATRMMMPKSCYHCKITFDDGDLDYKTFRNRIYCTLDFRHLFLPKCQSCHKPVEKEAISATDGKLQGKWHIECFHCQVCHAPFPNNTFYVFENQPYCKTHYHYLNNSLCNRCHQGIENLCAHTAEGWRFHPKCFTCEVCQERLSDTYYVFESRIYCETHIKRQPFQSHNNEHHHQPPLDKRRTQIYDIL